MFMLFHLVNLLFVHLISNFNLSNQPNLGHTFLLLWNFLFLIIGLVVLYTFRVITHFALVITLA